ncbi:hypothetical protein HU200_049047 [Digitaria exilis]|uniref:F-box domain-containing protein n=1 Tax=Digitaria exilis TaxID=1010633 RepID=A0A835AUC4_9POAL|nr:hypothetical protein HU200_049047 [Digitaria exilis]
MADRLSSLPDKILQRILLFMPSREAASTAALSRRWRGLWPTPARTVILDTRSYGRDCTRDAFFHGADAALAAHGSVTSLAVHVEAESIEHGPDCIERFMSQINGGRRDRHHIAGDVLGHPSCRDVEELSVTATLPAKSSSSPKRMTARYRAFQRKQGEVEMPEGPQYTGCYKLSLAAVPSSALRVLRIDNCKDLTPAPGTALFPCMATLWLRRCVVSLFTLRDMIAGSPKLTALRLEGVYITTKVPSPDDQVGNYYGYGRHNGYGYRNADEVRRTVGWRP